MNNELISVIVPIYNCEKYLDKCIESIVNQTYKNIEIILIDDGSTDKSYTLCKKYYYNDKRIKLFRKKNGGVSEARNLGIDKANGTWIIFVDSDDILNYSMLEDFNKSIVKDIFLYASNNYKFTNDLNNLEEQLFFSQNNVINSKVFSLNILDSEYTSDNFKTNISNSRAIWSKLYYKKIIDNFNIRFDSNMRTLEDGVFNLEYLSHIDKIKLINKKLYYYRLTPNSLSRSINQNELEENKYKINKLNSILYEMLLDDDYYCCLSLYNYKLFVGYISRHFNDINIFNRSSQIKKTIKSNIFKIDIDKLIKHVSVKHKLFIFTIKHKLFLLSSILILKKSK